MFLIRLIQPCALLTCAAAAIGQGIGGGMQVEDEATIIDQRLGAFAARDATFLDEHGKRVTIGDYCKGERPIILNLQYFRCPTLCGPLLNGLVNALNEISLQPGKDFAILSVSFDHRENPEIATDKEESVLAAYEREGAAAHWHFLTGDQENIRKLADSVGYGFRWNQTRNDFDHRAAIIFISPSGKITRYFNRTYFDPRAFRLAIVESSEGTVGSAMDRFVLSCYGYDPLTGTYSRIGPMVMSIGGALTVAALATLLFVLWRRERRPVALAPAS